MNQTVEPHVARIIILATFIGFALSAAHALYWYVQ